MQLCVTSIKVTLRGPRQATGMARQLFYAKAAVFQLYHGGYMMYDMRRINPELTLLLT